MSASDPKRPSAPEPQGGDMEDYDFAAAIPDSVEQVEFNLKP